MKIIENTHIYKKKYAKSKETNYNILSLRVSKKKLLNAEFVLQIKTKIKISLLKKFREHFWLWEVLNNQSKLF